ncbi:hypothetical protein GLAREA_08677 [Glarea lozoyensis ATCC 20868]|uniref:Ricin B lectin domain-containing protein n=1 Tax=Glarea lozoyensis (strain ATCC 20868 / MF5171) TaxID=1116229 RepID=S3DH78_GLAL2|nr:uncharacterized protein GLAREA_08677 [Glarea lozoyensis ATCC 20868]EPE36514.1 hypothetical protein GLAREA_08677 [Glarea lozoyensis ATCC 20868]
MSNFDTNRWYQIYLLDNTVQSLAGTILYNQGRSGAVFIQDTNLTSGGQQWQIFPFNETYHVLRTKDSGPTGYLHASFSVDETTPGLTVPDMRDAEIQDDSMFWQIDPWGDGTFFMTNANNGSDWHLNVKDTGLMSLSSNVTQPQGGQQFNFGRLDAIDDVKYSSVILPPSASEPTQTPSPATSQTVPSPTPSQTTPSPTPSSTSSSNGLSSGAQAAIGASLGGAAAICFLILAFFLMRRRKRQKNSLEYPPEYSKDGSMGPFIRKVPNELDARTNPVELPTSAHSVELPVSRAK